MLNKKLDVSIFSVNKLIRLFKYVNYMRAEQLINLVRYILPRPEAESLSLVNLSRDLNDIEDFTGQDLQTILLSAAQNKIKKAPLFLILKTFQEKGLLTAESITHFAEEELDSPSFSKDNMVRVIDLIVDLSLAGSEHDNQLNRMLLEIQNELRSYPSSLRLIESIPDLNYYTKEPGETVGLPSVFFWLISNAITLKTDASIALVRLAVQLGADVNSPSYGICGTCSKSSGEELITPLIAAIRGNNPKLVELLINLGARCHVEQLDDIRIKVTTGEVSWIINNYAIERDEHLRDESDRNLLAIADLLLDIPSVAICNQLFEILDHQAEGLSALMPPPNLARYVRKAVSKDKQLYDMMLRLNKGGGGEKALWLNSDILNKVAGFIFHAPVFAALDNVYIPGLGRKLDTVVHLCHQSLALVPQPNIELVFQHFYRSLERYMSSGRNEEFMQLLKRIAEDLCTAPDDYVDLFLPNIIASGRINHISGSRENPYSNFINYFTLFKEDSVDELFKLLPDILSRFIRKQKFSGLEKESHWNVPDGFVDVDADGHCFYHAIARQINNAISSDAIHQLGIQYLTDNPDISAQFLVGLTDLSGETPSAATGDEAEAHNAYIEAHRGPHTWADHLMIQAVSAALNVVIEIYMFNADGTPQLNPANGQQVVITIDPPGGGIPTSTIVIGNIANVHFIAASPEHAEAVQSAPGDDSLEQSELTSQDSPMFEGDQESGNYSSSAHTQFEMPGAGSFLGSMHI